MAFANKMVHVSQRLHRFHYPLLWIGPERKNYDKMMMHIIES